ncbi:MAG: hypothetical protein CMH56_08080 [Myxococcales bacterium]|nr:hypothetical protein [Myxococcales bacterium]|tara:strand:+ start:7752 stop:9731 length:1980 start_codon:yes stop_codon:yes gene_type:complete
MVQQVIGLDMDQHQITGVLLEAPPRSQDWYVAKIFEKPLPPPTDADGNPRTLAQRQKAGLSSLMEGTIPENATVITAFSTQEACLTHLEFPFRDQRKIEAVLPGMLETEVPFDVDDLALSWRVQNSGRKALPGEGANVLVGFAKRDKVSQHLGLWQDFPVVPRHIRFDAQTLSSLYPWIMTQSFHDTEEPTPGLAPLDGVPAMAVLELGQVRTRICMMQGEQVLSARTIGRGLNEAVEKVSQIYGISRKEALEAIEREAFIEVADATASFQNQKQLSDALKMALLPIVREIRQTFQSLVSSHKARVTRVYVTGPGSAIRNVVPYLSEHLQVEVDLMRGLEPLFERLAGLENPTDRKSQERLSRNYVMPLALALSGLGGDHNRRHADFRVGDFAWKGELDFVRERIGAMAVWLFLICFLIGGNGMTRSALLSQKADGLSARQTEACKKITGQPIESTSRCMGIIREQISQGGKGGFTQKSAVDSYVEIAMRMPPDLDVKITELDIKPEAIRLKGKSGQFDEVDKIVTALMDGRCFTKVEKGKARKLKEGVEFQISMNIDCEANPGKPLPKREKSQPEKKKNRSIVNRAEAKGSPEAPKVGIEGKPAVKPRLPTPALGRPKKPTLQKPNQPNVDGLPPGMNKRMRNPGVRPSFPKRSGGVQ